MAESLPLEATGERWYALWDRLTSPDSKELWECLRREDLTIEKKKKKGQRWFSLGHQGFSGEVLTNFTQNGKGLYLLKWLLQRPHCLIFLSQGSIIAGNEAFKINNLRTESIFPMLGSSRGNASESSSPGPLQGGASAEGVAIMEWWGRRSHDLGSVLAVPVKCALVINFYWLDKPNSRMCNRYFQLR